MELYQALYRKYRPQKFEDIYGQNVIVKTLKNSILHKKIGHAYMFSGPRGTGKTTIAKIFARAVNCLNSIDGEACETCSNCLNSFSKECVDIIEIDAASNNGVDEIRELKNKVNIVPSNLKYKIYIIDEVHMLSIGAFNALLKTLEEPPEHVIFILATTDPQKVPITIISRCQCYQFKRIDDISMYNRLKKIVELENFQVDDDVLNAIVSVTDGGLRDAIGLLDQITSYKNGHITLNDFHEIYGNLMENELDNFINLIFQNNVKGVIDCIEKYNCEGKNIIQIMKQVTLTLKNRLIDFYLYSKKMTCDEEIIIQLINQLNERMFDIKKTDDPKTYLEIFLLNFMHKNLKDEIKEEKDLHLTFDLKEKNGSINYKELSDENMVEEKISKVQKEKENQTIQKENKVIDQTKEMLEKMCIEAHNVLVNASKSELNLVKDGFDKLSDFTFDSNIGYIVCYLMDGNLRAANQEKFILSYEYESMIEKILPSLDKMMSNFNKITNLKKKIVCITDHQWDKLKKDFIYCKQNGISFEQLPEKAMSENNDISNKEVVESKASSISTKENETLSLFGDIVEIN